MHAKLRIFVYFRPNIKPAKIMNWLDIVIIVLLAIAVWTGWRQGLVTQILGLAALVLGIFLAWKYGEAIGIWLGVEAETAWIAGFAIVFIVVLVAVVLIGRLTRGLFRIVGLGVFDNMLGALFSALKMVLFAGLLMMFDPGARAVPESVREGSVMFEVVDGVCDTVFPFVKNMFSEL